MHTRAQYNDLSPDWNACFLLCSFALGGWMILYLGQLRLGVVVFRNNVFLLFSLVLAVRISQFARFAGPQRYIAVLVLALSLVAFHIAVPGLTSPRLLFHLLINENPAGVARPPRHAQDTSSRPAESKKSNRRLRRNPYGQT